MKDLLKNEVKSEMDILSNMTVGGPEYSAAVKGIDTLVKNVVELEKLEAERYDKSEELVRQSELESVKRELDERERQNRLDLQEKQLEMQQKQLELQEKQHKETKRNNTIQLAVVIGTALLGAALKVWGTDKCLKFEEEGTITTTPGKFHVGSLFGKK